MQKSVPEETSGNGSQRHFLCVLEIDNNSVSVDNKLDSHQQAFPLCRFHRTAGSGHHQRRLCLNPALPESRIRRAGAPLMNGPSAKPRGTKLKPCFVFCRRLRRAGPGGHESQPLTGGQGDPAAGRCGVWTRVTQPLTLASWLLAQGWIFSRHNHYHPEAFSDFHYSSSKHKEPPALSHEFRVQPTHDPHVEPYEAVDPRSA